MPLAADWLHLAAITRRQLHRWAETRLTLKIGQTERRKNEPKRSKHHPPDRPTKMCLVYNPENEHKVKWLHIFIFLTFIVLWPEKKMDINWRLKFTPQKTFLSKQWRECFGDSFAGKHQSPDISQHKFLPKMHCRVLKMALWVLLPKLRKPFLKMKYEDENMLILNPTQSTNIKGRAGVGSHTKPLRFV